MCAGQTIGDKHIAAMVARAYENLLRQIVTPPAQRLLKGCPQRSHNGDKIQQKSISESMQFLIEC